jgi:moderate conductance mechanosensitive channel
MRRRQRWFASGTIVFLMMAFVPSLAMAKPPKAPKLAPGPAPLQEVKLPENATPEQVDAFLAGLSDEQARKLLAERLKREAEALPVSEEPSAKPGRASGIAALFGSAEDATAALSQRLGAVFAGAGTVSSGWPEAWARLTGGKGFGQFAANLAIMLLIVLGGLAAERFLLRMIAAIHDYLMKAVLIGRLQKFGFIVSNLLIEALGVACFVLVTFILFVVIYDPPDSGHLPASVFLVASYYFRLIMFAARVILSPRASGLRLAPMSDADAGLIYRWMMRIVAVCAVMAAIAFTLQETGISRDIFLLIYASAGAGVSALLIALILQVRERVARAIAPSAGAVLTPAQALQAKLSEIWHWMAILYVAAAGISWTIRMLTRGDGHILNLIYSLFLIPLFIGVDQWVQKLLAIASGGSREIIELGKPEDGTESAAVQLQEPKRAGMETYVPLIKQTFRGVLVVFFLFATLRLWGFDIAVGRLIARDVVSVLLVLILGLIAWQLIKARIDQKLREEMPMADEDAEEGGAGGSRSATLLMLLRKFIFAVFFVIITLMVLSSLGVDIGPLIAGAGVIGLAIGFGAQTLVKDIIAGVFFLIDDAFRVGDYVEAGAAKGSVEQISLRSMKLRHPRGQVFTIPFGDLKTVTNFSRDYIITKLDFRVRYDADPEKIRKVIKRINKEVLQDDEVKRVMLGDIKSQGVREMDDSAMVLRVKFKTIPGEQFRVRREVFHRVQKAFRDSGIEFAHRNVTVHLPPEIQSKRMGEMTEAEKKAVEAGAAAAALAREEDEKKAEADAARKKK